jgi:hypothetical protein
MDFYEGSFGEDIGTWNWEVYGEPVWLFQFVTVKGDLVSRDSIGIF